MMRAVATVLALLALRSSASPTTKNVLVIIVDDLRPQLAPYGATLPSTPNVARLAEGALTFHRAFVQQAVCAPSRNSFMTGRRPDTTKCWNFINHFRQVGPDWITMPEWFKHNGYVTLGGGKTFHPGLPPNYDEPKSWSQEEPYFPFIEPGCDGSGEEVVFDGSEVEMEEETWDSHVEGKDHIVCPSKKGDNTFFDHKMVNHTIAAMKLAVNDGKPFFIMSGHRRPHLPWRMPQRFYDMYNESAIPLSKQQTIGENVTLFEFTETGINSPYGVAYDPYLPLPDSIQQHLRHGYYASVSWTDSQVGLLLDALDEMNLTNDTVVAFWGDHGWKLGEHAGWCKTTNWELDARTPLIIRAPWITASVGQKTGAIAELVDMYPTLTELAGLPQPPTTEGLEGVSLASVLHDPSSSVKPAGFSQFPRCLDNPDDKTPWKIGRNFMCHAIDRKKFTHMGYSMRTADWRYTEWRHWKTETLVGDWTEEGLVAVEMYDHSQDDGMYSFDCCEFVSLAYQAQYNETQSKLSAQLRAQFDR